MIPRGRSAVDDAAPGWLARQVRALFAEARRRRRRRRLAVAVVLVASAALAGAAVAGYAASRPGTRSAQGPGAVPGHRTGFSLPSAQVAWFDSDGVLRVGNVATLAQRAVGHLGRQPCCRMIVAGRAIYWAGQVSGRDYIQEYDRAAGVIRNVAPGWAVFASASGREVYLAQSARRLLVLRTAGAGRARELVTPPGWKLVPLPWAVAGGIVLSSGARRPVIGVWRPGGRAVTPIGHGSVLATWTGQAGSGSLIAWRPAACRTLSCPVEITSTATGRTLAVRSPARFGFLTQGNDAAFSPDGRTLAALVSISPLNPDASARFVPALVDTLTGAVRLIRHAVLANGELAGWLVWLPGGSRLLAGPAARIDRYAGFAIDTATGRARPFSFFAAARYPASSGSDITWGAALIPQRPASRSTTGAKASQ